MSDSTMHLSLLPQQQAKIKLGLKKNHTHTQIGTTHPGVLISLQLIPALQRMPQIEKQHTTETERLWDTIIVLNK
jgi:hypothetical protein